MWKKKSQQKVSSGKGGTDKESTDQEVRSDILDDSDADPHFYPPGKDTPNESSSSAKIDATTNKDARANFATRKRKKRPIMIVKGKRKVKPVCCLAASQSEVDDLDEEKGENSQ